MFLHLGSDYVISEKNIIGIFDIETVSSNITKSFFKTMEKEGRVITVTNELPKSVVLCESDIGRVCYISQLSAATLKKRLTTMAGFTE